MYRPSTPPKPIEIDKFLGVNETLGETELRLGEATKQVNFRITNNYKLQKRPAHNTFIDYGNSKDVHGMWYGQIKSKEVLISINNGIVYEYNYSTKINSKIGNISDNKTSIFYFQSKLYFLNGVDYKEYDGTSFQDVVPYIPTIAISTNPAGGGEDFEPINLLTGTKKQEFIGDGTSTEYYIRGLNVNSIDSILVNGIETSATKDLALGKVTFSTAPINKAVVIIKWTKTEEVHSNLVKNHRFAMTYGVSNDTSVFIWGNPNEKNARRWSATEKANYFPVSNVTYVGTNEFAITDIVSVYDRQVIFKEDRTHYSVAEYIQQTNTWEYPVYDLNENVGNIVFNGVQLVDNSPISIKGQSWWKWTSTNVEDERNAVLISERLRESLSEIDLTKAITFDNQKQKEYWCNVGDMVYILNYYNDTMYTYDNVNATCFIDIKGTVYYGSKGTIERFEGKNDNGVPVVARMYLTFMDFGTMELYKVTNDIYASIQPDTQTSCTIYYETNKKNILVPLKKIRYKIFDFNIFDFNDFTFLTNRNPQTFTRRLNANNYTVIRFMIENREVNESLLFLSLKIPAECQGRIR